MRLSTCLAVLLLGPGLAIAGTAGAGANRFPNPEGVAVRGNDYYISDSGNNRVVRYTIVTN